MKEMIRRLSEILFRKQNTTTGYKFVSGDLRSFEGDRPQWTPGVALTYDGEVIAGFRGFHASSDLYSVFNNHRVDNLCLSDRLFEVEARDVVYCGKRLFAANEMTLTREIDLKPLSVEYAIGCARHVLPNFERKYPDDARPREAIKAAEKWLKEPTEENRISAWSAANYPWPAGDSAWSAMYAARSTTYAAGYALSAAEYAARAAANPAMEKKWQANLLEELVKKHYL